MIIVAKKCHILTRRALLAGLGATIIVPKARAGFVIDPYRVITPPILDGKTTGLTGAWSMGRQLLTAYGGSFFTNVSGAVSELLDQSGAARNLTQATAANRPTVGTAGPKSKACATFDGSSDSLAGAVISSFIANNNGYVIGTFIAVAIGTNAANIWDNDPVFADAGGFMGVHLTSATPNINSFNWDGSADTAAIAIATGTVYVAEWRHTGGNLSMRINGGSYSTVASGNTSTMVNALTLGRAVPAGAFSNIHIFEMAAYNTVPSQGDQDAIAASFLAWVA